MGNGRGQHAVWDKIRLGLCGIISPLHTQIFPKCPPGQSDPGEGCLPLYSTKNMKCKKKKKHNFRSQRATLWGQIHVLQWLFGHVPVEWCNDWRYIEATKDNAFVDHRPACPCTIDQAFLDAARFSPHPECDIDQPSASGVQLHTQTRSRTLCAVYQSKVNLAILLCT